MQLNPKQGEFVSVDLHSPATTGPEKAEAATGSATGSAAAGSGTTEDPPHYFQLFKSPETGSSEGIDQFGKYDFIVIFMVSKHECCNLSRYLFFTRGRKHKER